MEEQYIQSAQDQLKLRMVICEPAGEIKGVVQISHGMGEHVGRYAPFMEFLSDNGYAAVCHDHRGHGQSVKSQEDLGYFYDRSGGYLVEDLKQVSTYIKKRFRHVPLFLFAHSMGTLAARCYIQHSDDALSGLILCGPPCRQRFVRGGIAALRLFGAVRGQKYRSTEVQYLMDRMFMKNFKEEQAPAWICSDAAEVERYKKDPQCGFAFTVNGYLNLLGMLRDSYQQERYEVKNSALPVLFLAGEEDPVVGGKPKLREQVQFLSAVGYKNIKWKMYEGKRHELLREDIRQTVYDDVLRWIKSNVLVVGSAAKDNILY
ncbi:MAG: alpha/beta fold hydrolase [Lachnospiraceae bacterium]